MPTPPMGSSMIQSLPTTSCSHTYTYFHSQADFKVLGGQQSWSRALGVTDSPLPTGQRGYIHTCLKMQENTQTLEGVSMWQCTQL